MNAIQRVLSQLPAPTRISRKQLMEIFARGPIKIQRDHTTRAKKVKYLRGMLVGNQLEFAAVMWKGQLRLVDGYTRCESLERGISVLPPHGTVMLMTYSGIRSMKVLAALYDQFNSPASSKKASCRYSEGQRAANMLGRMTSDLVIRLQKSAPGYVFDMPTLRDAVTACEKAFWKLDSFGLKRTYETTAISALYLAVCQFAGEADSEKVEQFIRKVNQTSFSAFGKGPGDQKIEAFREAFDIRKKQGTNTGGSNVNDILHQGLYAAAVYLGKKRILGETENQLTMSEFVRIMSR